jgi:hypothetical protein
MSNSRTKTRLLDGVDRCRAITRHSEPFDRAFSAMMAEGMRLTMARAGLEALRAHDPHIMARMQDNLRQFIDALNVKE